MNPNVLRYEAYYQRFRSIFKADKDILQYFIPGNHDVGYVYSPYSHSSCQLQFPISLGLSTSFSPRAYTRYISHFGAPNFEISLANHTLVMFDAPGYADEDSKRHGQKKLPERWVPIPGRSVEFMKKFASSKFILWPK